MKFKPYAVDLSKGFNHRVYVRRAEAKVETKGGLTLPDSAKREQPYGTVLASSSPNLKPGDIVLFDGYGGRTFAIDNDEPFTIYDESEIVGVNSNHPNEEQE